MTARLQEAPALLVALATADVHLGNLASAADNYRRATRDVTVGTTTFPTYTATNV